MSTTHMILENGVLKVVPLPEKPVVFRGEIHGNSKWMGGLYPCRGAAVEVVSNTNPFHAAQAPIIQEAPEEEKRIVLPKPVIDITPAAVFATATIAFDEEDEPEVQDANEGSAVESVEAVAKSLASEDVRGIGMTQREFNAYQLKGAQVRKLYELFMGQDASEIGVSNMTKALLTESGRSDERKALLLKTILDIKRGAQ